MKFRSFSTKNISRALYRVALIAWVTIALTQSALAIEENSNDQVSLKQDMFRCTATRTKLDLRDSSKKKVIRKRNSKWNEKRKYGKNKRSRYILNANCGGEGGSGGYGYPTPTRTKTPTRTPTPTPTPLLDVVDGIATDRLIVKANTGENPSTSNCFQQKAITWSIALPVALYVPQNLLQGTTIPWYIVSLGRRRGGEIFQIQSDIATCPEAEAVIFDYIANAPAPIDSDSVVTGNVDPGVLAGVPPLLIPNDPLFASGNPNSIPPISAQWGLYNTAVQVCQPVDEYGNQWSTLNPAWTNVINPRPDIHAAEAWYIHPNLSSSAVTVAVLDSGVDPHPEFSSRLLPGANAHVLNPDGTVTSDASDQNGHGTRVAGIIAAQGNNGAGIAGMSWGTKILPVRITKSREECVDPDGDGQLDCDPTASAMVKGIYWAVDHGANIINISAGFTRKGTCVIPICEVDGTDNITCEISPQKINFAAKCPNDPHAFLYNATAFANSMGVLCVASTGNYKGTGDTPLSELPAAFDTCLAVGATDPSDTRLSFSKTEKVDLVAPGSSITTTSCQDLNPADGIPCDSPGYRSVDGTSASAAFVSGAAALLLAQNPNLTPLELKTILTQSADKLYDCSCPAGGEEIDPTIECLRGGVDANFINSHGAGRLNVFRALSQTPQPTYSVSVEVALQGLLPTVNVTREVVFTLTSCDESVPEARIVPMNFSNGRATTVLEGVDPNASFISAQEGHTLRRRLPLDFSGNSNISVSFTALDQLLCGDLKINGLQNNSVDLGDYSLLQNAWNQLIDPNASYGADINGDGVQGSVDFTCLQTNWGAAGDSEALCPAEP